MSVASTPQDAASGDPAELVDCCLDGRRETDPVGRRALTEEVGDGGGRPIDPPPTATGGAKVRAMPRRGLADAPDRGA